MIERVKAESGLIFKTFLFILLAFLVGCAVYWSSVIGTSAEGNPVVLGVLGAIMILVGMVFTGFFIHPNLGEQSSRIDSLKEIRSRLSINKMWVVWGIPVETLKIVNLLIEDVESKKSEISDAIFYFCFSVLVTAIGTYFVVIGLYADFSNKKIEAKLAEQNQSFRENKMQCPLPIEAPPSPVLFYLPASLLPMQQRK